MSTLDHATAAGANKLHTVARIIDALEADLSASIARAELDGVHVEPVLIQMRDRVRASALPLVAECIERALFDYVVRLPDVFNDEKVGVENLRSAVSRLIDEKGFCTLCANRVFDEFLFTKDFIID